MLLFTPKPLVGAAILLMASLAHAVPLYERLTCLPKIQNRVFSVRLHSDSSLVWTNRDALLPQGVHIQMAAPSHPLSRAQKWYADTSDGARQPPILISTALNPHNFCVNSYTWGSVLSGAECDTTSINDKYRINCASCNTAKSTIGTSCTVYSLDWGQCAAYDPNSSLVVLKECDATNANQHFDLKAAD